MMTELSAILFELRSEIDRLVADGIEQSEAISQAVDTVLSRAAYAETTSPHEARLLDVIERVSADTRRPVATHRICSEVGSDYFITYYHLRNLERRGLLCRPSGPRSGWQVA